MLGQSRGEIASFGLGLHSVLPPRLQVETDGFYLMMAAAEGGNASGGRIGSGER
jgi:hypothetical protein